MNLRAQNGTPFVNLPPGYTVMVIDTPRYRWYKPVRLDGRFKFDTARISYEGAEQAAWLDAWLDCPGRP